MKVVRFLHQNRKYCGILMDNEIRVVEGNIYEDFVISNRAISLMEVELLVPCKPSKIICVGLNYYSHIEEMAENVPPEPLIFLKPTSALLAHHGVIQYPPYTCDLQYEAELAVVINRRIRHVSEEEAAGYIFGYTCANDVTARDLQKKDGQWTRAKSFDTFCPLGPWIETEFSLREKRHLSLYLNGERKQYTDSHSMIFSVSHIIAYISSIMTLEAGDVILTGTPEGTGAMQIGDTVAVKIDGLGQLMNRVGKY